MSCLIAEVVYHRRELHAVLPLQKQELEFLERLNGAGDIAPELLTDEPAMQAIVRLSANVRA